MVNAFELVLIPTKGDCVMRRVAYPMLSLCALIALGLLTSNVKAGDYYYVYKGRNSYDHDRPYYDRRY